MSSATVMLIGLSVEVVHLVHVFWLGKLDQLILPSLESMKFEMLVVTWDSANLEYNLYVTIVPLKKLEFEIFELKAEKIKAQRKPDFKG